MRHYLMSVHFEVMMGTIGPRLRAAREARNLSVQQAADDTRISLRFLEALEREEFEALPAPVYVRGFLRSYANYLGLEPQSLLDELNGDNSAESLPSPYLRAPDRRPQRPSTPPGVAAEPVAPVEAVSPPGESEWDPEPEAGDEPDDYDDGWDDYRAQPVPGVLSERGYQGGGSGTARTVMLAGIALIVVIAVVAAALAMRGGDDDSVPVVGDDEETTPTQSGGGAGRTVIAVGSATVEGSPGTENTPGAAETPTPGTTPGEDGTASTESTPTQAATSEPGATATPTATTAPTLTSTPVPPTATPVPTATVQPHPFELAECTAGGGTSCGTPPYRVICAPDGWFVDKDGDYAKPPEWFEFTVNSTFGINGVVESTCP